MSVRFNRCNSNFNSPTLTLTLTNYSIIAVGIIAVGSCRSRIKNQRQNTMGKEIVKDCDRNIHIFSHSKLDIFVGKYLNIFVVAGWITILILETFWGATKFSNFKIQYPNISINLLLPLFFSLSLLFYFSLIKFAYQVVFDFDNKLIIFSLYRKNRSISFNLNELKVIRINWFIIFVFNDGKTIWYKSDETFIRFLKRFDINREWGSIGKYFMKREFKSDRE